MDGKNVDTVLTELGVRFHRLIHEHLQQYSYSSMGGMLAICDVAEYRRCAKDFRVSGGAEVQHALLVTGQSTAPPAKSLVAVDINKVVRSNSGERCNRFNTFSA